ncbi:hypothetical protein K1719_020926 [Acacia pycnantha]|nr:hypothetical protein K1719_020926 [Acacia pycnantha]
MRMVGTLRPASFPLLVVVTPAAGYSRVKNKQQNDGMKQADIPLHFLDLPLGTGEKCGGVLEVQHLTAKFICFGVDQDELIGAEDEKSLKYDKISLRCFDLKELEKATYNFSPDCLLGSGAFGTVYKGTFELKGTLAIKKAHGESFVSKAKFIKGDGVQMLVYEYVPNGSLLEYMMMVSFFPFFFFFLVEGAIEELDESKVGPEEDKDHGGERRDEEAEANGGITATITLRSGVAL